MVIHSLGKSESGQEIDLLGFMSKLSNNVTAVMQTAQSLQKSHPEWRDLAQQAANLYSTELLRVRAVPEAYHTAKGLGLSVPDVLLANTASLMILFGLSHYLQSCGFDIDNPTAFEEISVKLSPFRNAVVLLGFEMLRRTSNTGHRRRRQEELWQRSFILGLAMGYLIADAHSQIPTISAPFLSTPK